MLIERLYTHAGRPHLDDAYCAFIAKTLGCDDIRRVNKLPEDVDVFNYMGVIAADIGDGVYDHHDYCTPERDDGYTHCAASLMWKWFGTYVVKELFPTCQRPDKIAKRIDREILSTIAAYDNGEGPDGVYTIYQEANSFVPAWNSTKSMDEAFEEMVDFAKKITVRVGENAISIQEAEPIVAKAISKMEDGIIVLPQFAPWQAYVIPNDDARFVVFPSNRGGWILQGVPIGHGMKTIRCSFDKKWLGKAGAEAEELWHGMTFCHPGNFMAAFTTKHSAINAAKHLIRIDLGPWKKSGAPNK